MNKRIPDSKRSQKRRVLAVVKKLLPGFAVYVRRKTGEMNYYSESWWLYIGKRGWSKMMCNLHGHCCWSCRSSEDLIQWVKEEIQRDSFKIYDLREF